MGLLDKSIMDIYKKIALIDLKKDIDDKDWKELKKALIVSTGDINALRKYMTTFKD